MVKLVLKYIKKYGIVLEVILLIVVIAAYSRWDTTPSKASSTWKPKIQDITLEYGDTTKVKAMDFIKEQDADIKGSLKIEIPIETDKEYYKVGEYEGTLQVTKGKDTSKHTVKVVVKDTKAPKFIKTEKELRFIVGAENINLEEQFTTEDFSEVKISVDGNVDFNTVGEYDIILIATDAYGNKAQHQIKVIIEDQPIDDASNPEEEVTDTDDYTSYDYDDSGAWQGGYTAPTPQPGSSTNGQDNGNNNPSQPSEQENPPIETGPEETSPENDGGTSQPYPEEGNPES